MKNYITKLLNIDPETIDNLNIISLDDSTTFEISLIPTYPDCPFCGSKTKIHGKNRPKTINHPKLSDERCTILFHSTRYMCTCCGKTFSEDNPFSFSGFKNTYFSINQIMKDLANLHLTFKDIADKNHISTTTVQHYSDSFINFPRLSLPENIGIDELHSSMASRTNSHYICVMVDNNKRVPFEILPSRSKKALSNYFSNIPREERMKVKYFTMDMWEPYKDVAEIYLPNAEIAVDTFHVIKHLEDALTRARINVQKQFEYESDAYYLLKTWHKLLEHNIYLDNEPKYNKRFKSKVNKRQILEMILLLDENLKKAYELKELYLEFNEIATMENASQKFEEIYKKFIEADIPEYREFTRMINYWKEEIINSFHRPYDNRKQTNALCENINGRIREYLVISNGITNFTRFRKRVLYALNKTILYRINDNLRSDKYEGIKRGKYNKKIIK